MPLQNGRVLIIFLAHGNLLPAARDCLELNMAGFADRQ
jgi:hypothetical protein